MTSQCYNFVWGKIKKTEICIMTLERRGEDFSLRGEIRVPSDTNIL